MLNSQATFMTVRGHTFYTSPLGADSVIVDLGANHGVFARRMSELVGGRYYLVEANPELQQLLKSETTFPVLFCAVAAHDGPIQFNLSKNDEGSSILTLPESSEYNCVLERSLEVPGKELRSILAEFQLARVDLLKVDIEGAEIGMLGTADPTVLENIGQITVEFHGEPVFGFGLQSEVERVMARLEGLGFVALDFSFPRRTDVLFVNLPFHGLSAARGWWWQLRYIVKEQVRRRMSSRAG
jgi:FkbM family methyltransferase